MTTTTDATLQQLADRNEIAGVLHRLGVILDDGTFDDLPALLTDDVTVRTPGGAAEGREAAIAQARRNHAPEQPIQHVLSNLLVDLDGDRARVRANLVVHFGPPGGPAEDDARFAAPVEYTTGQVVRYDLVRTSGAWRLAGIRTTPVWRDGTPLPPPPPS
jgi:hypothetical protein